MLTGINGRPRSADIQSLAVVALDIAIMLALT
jgi:hypothetical protein